MKENTQLLHCPSCGAEIDADKLYLEQIEKQFLTGKESEIRAKAKEEAEQESAVYTKKLKEEVAEKSEALKDFHAKTAELEKIKREKDEVESRVKAESEKELNKKLAQSRAQIIKDEAEKNELKVLDLENQLNEQNFCYSLIFNGIGCFGF